MKYHVYINGNLNASFEFELHRAIYVDATLARFPWVLYTIELKEH